MLSAVIPSEHSYSAMQLASQPMHHRFVQPGPLVLRSDSLKFLTPTVDRDQTVSRRFEPSSRTALIDEQSNPWDLLQPQDAMSRHRGAKPPRRCKKHEPRDNEIRHVKTHRPSSASVAPATFWSGHSTERVKFCPQRLFSPQPSVPDGRQPEGWSSRVARCRPRSRASHRSRLPFAGPRCDRPSPDSGSAS